MLRLFRSLPPGRILEIGCGAGTLLHDLAEIGFHGIGVDRSKKACDLARLVHQSNPKIEITSDAGETGGEKFDYLASFEVLEHIRDDLGTLRSWRGYLREGGYLLLSVPAHPERWNAADDWAGHIRRYERQQLETLLTQAGFDVSTIHSYGFPLASVMERLIVPVYARMMKTETAEALDTNGRTKQSGTDRRLLTKLWPFYSFPVCVFVLNLFCRLQRLFVDTDYGVGYIVVARRVD
ncbi:MAG: class I SAM-dependent methyltransferase [Pseudomonadota bacterium]